MRSLGEILGVNRSWFYAAVARHPAAVETALRDRIEEIVLALPGYGDRRVAATLH